MTSGFPPSVLGTHQDAGHGTGAVHLHIARKLRQLSLDYTVRSVNHSQPMIFQPQLRFRACHAKAVDRLHSIDRQSMVGMSLV